MTNPNAAKNKKISEVTNKTMEELLTSMETSFSSPKVGDVVQAKVLGIARNRMWVDIDGRAVGIIEGRELSESRRIVSDLEVGDTVCASVMAKEDEEGHVILSLRRADAERGWDVLQKKFDGNELVNGRIMEANKGGLIIEVEGVRGFLPVSQLAPNNYPRVEGGDKEEILSRLFRLIGKEINVKVLNIDKENSKLIVSEKIAVTKEQADAINQFEIGQKIKGRITGIVKFGAFVKFGEDLEGLIHISEIAWDRVDNIEDYLKVGEEVEVMIIGIEGQKISLSRKRLQEDPWAKEANGLNIGDKVEGEVTRLTPFGAFVRIASLEGLVHVSELADEPVADPSRVLSLGDKREFRILSIEPEVHRISLSLKTPREKVADEIKKA